MITYLPHLLLAGETDADVDADDENFFQGAFSLVLIEKSFLAIFSANHKVPFLDCLILQNIWNKVNLFPTRENLQAHAL